ncbi:hypothetical protein HT031_006759 [Scenedesmus sp. PABB004]|nr:hypothetical protein HT031_006759 [Scenedesmus sp. PABB004]
MAAPRRGGLALLLLAGCLAAAAALPAPDRVLRRQDARKWRRVVDVSRIKARSAARQYLEDTSSELVVPIEVDVVLVGFDGEGGYGHQLKPERLLSLLSTHLQWYCPYSWETEEELGVCMHVNFQVIGGNEETTVGVLLRRLEAHIKANARQSHAAFDETAAGGQRKYYTVEASAMEPLFNEFLEHLYAEADDTDGGGDGGAAAGGGAGGANGLGGVTGTGSVVVGGARRGAGDLWHRHNTIFVINPSKVRMQPDGPPEAASHRPPNFLEMWQQGNYDGAKLEAEEAGYIYRYQYNGVGEAAVWHSSRSYLVVDLAAGPTTYGPLVSAGGAATPEGLPSIRATYEELQQQLRDAPHQQTVREAAGAAADRGAVTLLAGRLAAVLAAGVKAAFIPDMASQHLEQAKTVLVPLVVLSDRPISPDDAMAATQENYWGINVTHVEAALAHLLGEGQEAVVITSQHELHAHKQLAAALHKATRSHSEAVVDVPGSRDHKSAEVGMHSNSHTFIDPEVLLQEVERAADMLTHGLVTVAHTMGKDDEHHIAQLRHEGTRVVPVFVLALENHPEDVVLANRELVAADHDAVVVLQLRHGSKWGGPDDFFTGHMANGRRVVLDGAKSTRHVVAGLAQALAGVVPPYRHFEPGLGRQENDWRWACGATPFGPYSNYDGVSEIMQNAARRNELLAHVSAALRQLQHQLDAVDAFIAHHFAGPWEAAGMRDAHRHWLDTVASTRHGFNTTLRPDVVAALEGALSNVSTLVEELAMDMFTHDFKTADATVGERLLPAVAALCSGLDDQLDAAEEVMACCWVGARSVVAQGMLLLGASAGAAGVFFALVGVALCARCARRRAGAAVGLPSYGLPAYSARSGTWSL